MNVQLEHILTLLLDLVKRVMSRALTALVLNLTSVEVASQTLCFTILHRVVFKPVQQAIIRTLEINFVDYVQVVILAQPVLNAQVVLMGLS